MSMLENIMRADYRQGQSLWEICDGLLTNQARLHHFGMEPVSKSTLADARVIGMAFLSALARDLPLWLFWAKALPAIREASVRKRIILLFMA